MTTSGRPQASSVPHGIGISPGGSTGMAGGSHGNVTGVTAAAPYSPTARGGGVSGQGPKAYWLEEPQEGVYLWLQQHPSGRHELFRIRFSKKCFNAAGEWVTARDCLEPVVGLGYRL